MDNSRSLLFINYCWFLSHMVVFSIKEDRIVDQTEGQVLVIMRDWDESTNTMHRLREAGLNVAPDVYSEARLRQLVEDDDFPLGVNVIVCDLELWCGFDGPGVLTSLMTKLPEAVRITVLPILYTGESEEECYEALEALHHLSAPAIYHSKGENGDTTLAAYIHQWFEAEDLDNDDEDWDGLINYGLNDQDDEPA